MTTYQIISLIITFIGIPSVSSITGWAYHRHKKVTEKNKQETKTLKLGVQAMLRSQMINDYNKWHEDKKYAPIWARDNFENVWKQYEALGENGVMDDIHSKFMSLPTKPPKNN